MSDKIKKKQKRKRNTKELITLVDGGTLYKDKLEKEAFENQYTNLYAYAHKLHATAYPLSNKHVVKFCSNPTNCTDEEIQKAKDKLKKYFVVNDDLLKPENVNALRMKLYDFITEKLKIERKQLLTDLINGTTTTRGINLLTETTPVAREAAAKAELEKAKDEAEKAAKDTNLNLMKLAEKELAAAEASAKEAERLRTEAAEAAEAARAAAEAAQAAAEAARAAAESQAKQTSLKLTELGETEVVTAKAAETAAREALAKRAAEAAAKEAEGIAIRTLTESISSVKTAAEASAKEAELAAEKAREAAEEAARAEAERVIKEAAELAAKQQLEEAKTAAEKIAATTLKATVDLAALEAKNAEAAAADAARQAENIAETAREAAAERAAEAAKIAQVTAAAAESAITTLSLSITSAKNVAEAELKRLADRQIELETAAATAELTKNITKLKSLEPLYKTQPGTEPLKSTTGKTYILSYIKENNLKNKLLNKNIDIIQGGGNIITGGVEVCEFLYILHEENDYEDMLASLCFNNESSNNKNFKEITKIKVTTKDAKLSDDQNIIVHLLTNFLKDTDIKSSTNAVIIPSSIFSQYIEVLKETFKMVPKPFSLFKKKQEWYYHAIDPTILNNPTEYFKETKYLLPNNQEAMTNTTDINALNVLLTLSNNLRKIAKKENPTSKIFGKKVELFITALRNMGEGFLKSISKDKTLVEKLDEIEDNVTETLAILGPRFENRAKHEFDILELGKYTVDDTGKTTEELNNYNPQYAREIFHKFKKSIDEKRKEINMSKDDEKKLVARFSELMTFLQDIKSTNRDQILNQLDTELESDGVPIKFSTGNKQGRDKKIGGTDYNEYNIRIDGGAADDKAATEDNKYNPQKISDQIQELKIRVFKVNQFIENEVEAKYKNYKNQVFSKIFDNTRFQPSIIKDDWNITTDSGSPPKDPKNAFGMYKTLADADNDKNKWLEEIKGKLTEKKNELAKIRDEFLEICASPDIKSLNISPPYKVVLKVAFDGDFTEKPLQENNSSDSTLKDTFSANIGILSRIENISKALQVRFDEARSALKPLATSFEKATKEYIELNKRTPGYTYAQPQLHPVIGQGGGSGVEYDPVLFEIAGYKNNNKERVQDAITKIEEIFKKRTNPAFAASVSSPGMYSSIIGRFKNDSFTQGPIVAAQKMEESLKANRLLPSDVLKISTADRAIFACIALFLRAITIQITEYFIQNGTITNVIRSLVVFNIIYSAIFLLLVVYVNLDTYRLRIILNYINLNGNAGVVGAHIGLLYMLSFGIYIVISYMNFPIQGIKTVAVSEEDKAYLMYQLEIITMIVWMILLLLIALM